MPGLARLCEAASLAVRASRPGRGGAAGFTAYHVVALAVEALRRPLGRPQVERLLGVGEASARTLLRRLRELGVLEAERGGHRGTPRAGLLAELASHLVCSRIPGHPGMPWGQALLAATDLVDPPRDLTDVYRVRDYIVEAGCRVALIAGVEDSRLVAPGLEEVEGLIDHLAAVALEEIPWPRALTVAAPWECRWRVCAALIHAFYEEKCHGEPPG